MRSTILFFSLTILCGCGRRDGEEEKSQDAGQLIEAKSEKPDLKKNPKPQDYHKYIVALAAEVPYEIAAFKKSKYKNNVISYRVHPAEPECFLTLTISIKSAYLSDDIISPKWFTKAILITNIPDFSGKPVSVQGMIQSAQSSALNADSLGWGRIELLP
jgi:hypothetical protein